MKIVWFDLNSSYAHSSLALPALHAQVKEDTCEWSVVSATINEQVGVMVRDLYAQKPEVVVATLWLFNHEVMLQVLSRFKNLSPSCKIILGGPEFLGDNEAFLRKNTFVDCVFRGEGEEMFPRWLTKWRTPGEWHEIEGLCYLHESVYKDNGLARVADFSGLHAPEESCLFNWNKPFVQLETTRGCFNTCAFCVSGGEKPVRSLSMPQIRRRLAVISEHGIHDVRVLDRTFNFHAGRAEELLELFAEYAGRMRFHLEIHPAFLSQRIRQLLSQMPPGVLHLEAGIQSLRETVLQQAQRKGKLTAALEGLHFLSGLTNMQTHADLIAGLPGYGLEAMKEDVVELARCGVGEIQLESLKVLPGTQMRRRAEEWGLVYAPYPPYEVLQTHDITLEELQISHSLSRMLDGYYNTPAWREVTRRLLIHYPAFLDSFVAYLTEHALIDQPMSLEKRGLVLYEYCVAYYPTEQVMVSQAWIEAGMSLKKTPAASVLTKHLLPPEQWEEVYYSRSEGKLRWAFLPTDAEHKHGYWYGWEAEKQNIYPVFKARV
ncbi:MAG: DUF4080 domain-containing protein [Paludibacteraceae bacterium]|nr:DUF4080 domain-containing protein [Paludibacteraceae bacterium]